MARVETGSVYETCSGGALADEAPSGLEAAADAGPRERQEALLDEAVQETVPASDPIAVVRLI